jgi:hypothetical protein
MAGIVRSPRAILTELAAAPRAPWVDVLCVSTLVMFVSLAGLLMTSVGQTALLDQWERTATAFGRPVDDAFYARLQEWTTFGATYSAGTALLAGPVLALLVAAIIKAFVHGTGTSRVSFTSVLSMVSHASVILALRQVVSVPINYLGETFASPTTLALLVPGLDETSPVARFLGVIDLFVVWWAIVLAVGVAALAHRRIRPLAFTFTGVYVAVALLLALAMAATGGTA